MEKKWNKIKDDSDIKRLIKEYYGFHDSYICELNYKTGVKKNIEGEISLGELKDNKLYLKFESQCKEKALELCFIGVKRFNIVGWQEGYTCEIFECCLKIIKELEFQETGYVIWSDNESFTPQKIQDNRENTYVIANNLKWRYIEE